VYKLTRIAVLCVIILSLATPVFAQDQQPPAAAASTGSWNILAGTAFGIGMIILGASYGIGRIGSSAVESMARQPEVAANVQQTMLIAAALIEGVTFFALIVCLLSIFNRY
jgi:F-type H+-transporting ATPase subunit c